VVILEIHYFMKHTLFFIIIVIIISTISCIKHKSNKDLNCFGEGKMCDMDSQYVLKTIIKDSSCHQWDGVNVSNVMVPNTASIGDSVAIQLNAIAINGSANGNVLFAQANQNDITEIKTFLQYNICSISTQALINIPVIYYFKPFKIGKHKITFVNVYGDRIRIEINVNK
jgi:hypothetical protein